MASCLQYEAHFIFRCIVYRNDFSVRDRIGDSDAGSAVYNDWEDHPAYADSDRRAWSSRVYDRFFYINKEENYSSGESCDSAGLQP